MLYFLSLHEGGRLDSKQIRLLFIVCSVSDRLTPNDQAQPRDILEGSVCMVSGVLFL